MALIIRAGKGDFQTYRSTADCYRNCFNVGTKRGRLLRFARGAGLAGEDFLRKLNRWLQMDGKNQTTYDPAFL